MTTAERNLLMFLAIKARAELDDWMMPPSRGELRQRLDGFVAALQAEDMTRKKTDEPSV